MQEEKFLIGVDSDGTAFDSMGKKHIDAFIPAALRIWPMSAQMAERFTEIEKKVNLYSELRGINRFPGLLEAFERLHRERPEETDRLMDLEPLRAYIRGEMVYSPKTLSAWLAEHPSAELEKVMQWSNLADELFSKACEGIMPFTGVLAALQEASKQASVAVISSAAKAGLEKDWTAGGLMPYVSYLMTQEDGSKAEQLRKAMKACGEGVKALMIGDTQSDGEEAHKAGALFYPIIPGREEESWKEFCTSILPKFLEGAYGVLEEKEQIANLDHALNG